MCIMVDAFYHINIMVWLFLYLEALVESMPAAYSEMPHIAENAIIIRPHHISF